MVLDLSYEAPLSQALLSASQFSTWWSCKRKWGFQYLLKLPQPKGDALSTGLRVHKELEDYLKIGTPPGPILEPGLLHFPDRETPGIRIESYFSWRGWRGYKDVEVPGVVYDLKTSRSFSYKLTKDGLSKNVQAIVYAAEHMDRYGTEQVELRWVYCKTEGEPESKLVKISLTKSEADARFKIIEEHAQGIHEARALGDVMALEPNPRHCSAYGGCPYRDQCNLSPSEQFVLGPEEELFP